MPDFTGTVLTDKGRDLLAKVHTGVSLHLTKVSIGDGQHDQSQRLEEIEELTNPLQELGITYIRAEGGECKLRCNVTNEGLAEGFYVRELGIHAYDPDHGEILFAVSTAREADYLPAEGGTTIINNEFEISIIVANAANITATISNAGYVPRSEFLEWTVIVDTTREKVDENTEEISNLRLRLSNLERSFSNNFTQNQFTEDFNTLEHLKVSRGVYDAVNRRMVV